jgi:hypothetical protein
MLFTEIPTGVSFSGLEDLFEDLQDAIEEIDVDDLVEFSSITGKSIAGAARTLVSGIAEFTNMTKEGGKLAGENIGSSSPLGDIKTGLVAYFSNLEDLFDEVDDAIEELDMDSLLEFAKLANTNLAGAVKSLSKGIAQFQKEFEASEVGHSAGIFGEIKTGLVAYFSNLEDLFSEVDSAIGELDMDDLLKFAELSKVNLSMAVKSLSEGINEFGSLKFTFDVDSDKLVDLRATFFQFNAVLGSINMENVVNFAKLAEADLTMASSNLKSGMEALAGQTITVSEDNLEKIKTALEGFNTVIGDINFENINNFAKLADADLTKAGENLKSGVESFAKLTFTATSESFKSAESALEGFNNALGQIEMDQVIKFGELADKDLATAATNLKSGFDALLTVSATIGEKTYSSIENLQYPLSSLAIAFGQTDIFSKLSSFT